MLICHKWDVPLARERKLIMNTCYYMYMHEVFTFSYTLCMFYSAVGKAKYTEIHTKLSLAIILEIHASFLFASMKSLYIYI